ncbi:hypothetical protein RvY_01815 [Ramazzottius varieornatus]|uniref:Uncharacterized protein n=1 Tax=Ramazzottius varieornatus TaxID=947166 RepID=A0A1D1USB9_RAMVA|nr:hypothetical protein RvY_01815 [Ramazzottius varieornatus]
MARQPVRSLDDVPVFSWADYVVLALMLAISAGIGIFHGCTGGKQRTAGEFLLGDRNLHIFPVAMSLLSGFLSSVTLLGIPSETYMNGMGYWLICLSFCIAIPMVIFVYMPIFYNLRCISVFEYLEKRFSRPLRIYALNMFVLNMIIYLAVVLYGPSTALSAVTQIPEWACILIVGSICTFYTSIGGVKAVIWTDTFQLTLMFGGAITVLAVAIYHVGGLDTVVDLGQRSGRFDDLYNFSVDPKSRHTVWSVIIGGVFFWLSIYGVNQSQVQRYLSLPTLRQAQLCLWTGLPGFIAMITITSWTGLAFYGYFRYCDPLWQGLISFPDQILPLFTMETLGHLPGLPGLVVIGVFSGSLSTISSGVNSLAANFLEDCCRLLKPDLSVDAQAKLSRAAAVGFGLCCIGLAFVVSMLGGVIEFAYALFGMISGPLLGLFASGIFFPWTNSKGAAVGFTVGLTMTLWVGIGAKLAGPMYPQPVRGRTVDPVGCPSLRVRGDYPMIKDVVQNNAEILDLYEMSYLWYGPLGCATTVLIASLVSLCTGRTHGEDVDPRLCYPLFANLAFCLPERIRRKLWFGVPYDKVIVDPDAKDPTHLLRSGLASTATTVTIVEQPPPSPSIIVTPASPEFPQKGADHDSQVVQKKERAKSGEIDSLEYEIKMTVL